MQAELQCAPSLFLFFKPTMLSQEPITSYVELEQVWAFRMAPCICFLRKLRSGCFWQAWQYRSLQPVATPQSAVYIETLSLPGSNSLFAVVSDPWYCSKHNIKMSIQCHVTELGDKAALFVHIYHPQSSRLKVAFALVPVSRHPPLQVGPLSTCMVLWRWRQYDQLTHLTFTKINSYVKDATA